MAFSSSERAGEDGEAVPELGKNRESDPSGVTGLGIGESSRWVWRGE